MSTNNFTPPTSSGQSKTSQFRSTDESKPSSYSRNSNSDNTKGYKIIIVILTVIVLTVTGLFFMNINDLKEANGILNNEKMSLTVQLTSTIDSLNNITTENVEINKSLEIQKQKADSLLKAINKERRFSRSKIKQYKGELGTLRTVMKQYVTQIDSLNSVNQVLAEENIQYRSKLELSSLRISAAEEQTQELTAKLRKGEIITARDIELLVSRKSNGKLVKAKRARNMRIDFAISANTIATPGNRMVYCVVTTPDGMTLTQSSSSIFVFEGEQMNYTASREIDYGNKDLKISLYHDCTNLKPGEYKVQLFMDNYSIGNRTIILE